MPEVIKPLSLINFPRIIVVVSANAVAKVVLEGTNIVISIRIMHSPLERSRGIEKVTLKPLTSRKEERLLYGLHSYIFEISNIQFNQF